MLTMMTETYEFHVITMKTGKGTTLYLGVDDLTGAKKWTVKQQDAIYFDMEDEATSFAKTYFKKFKEWKVMGVEQVM